MDAVTAAVFVGIFVVILIAVNAARGRGRGDVAGGKGPFSTGMETRGGLAALGTTLDERPDRAPDESPNHDAVDHD